MSAPRRPLPQWARDASLGVFVHWGPYSVPAWAEPTGALGAVPDDEWFAHNAYAEWYANTIRIEGSPAAEHHAHEYGGAPYDAFLDEWRAEAYDPGDWARLFRAIGADYVVPTTKHHDGVALWDAPGSGDLTTVARGPRRDLIGPLAEAVRAEGLRFGVYYSGRPGLGVHRPPAAPLERRRRDAPADGCRVQRLRVRPRRRPRRPLPPRPDLERHRLARRRQGAGTRTRSSRCSPTTGRSCPRAS